MIEMTPIYKAWHFIVNFVSLANRPSHIHLLIVIASYPRSKAAVTSRNLIARVIPQIMTSSQELLRSGMRGGVLRVHCFFKFLPLVFALAGSLARAQEHSVFLPPKCYAIERYEAGWNKNPFTLKTAPALVPQASFAKDLAIASIYGDRRDPTVSIVNVKTHERFLLKAGRPNAHGIELKEASVGLGRKDTVVRIAMGAELCEVRYDNDYLMQLTASASARTDPATLQLRQQTMQQQPGQPTPAKPQPLVRVRKPNPGAPGFTPTSLPNSQPAYAAGAIVPQYSGSSYASAGGKLGAGGDLSLPTSSQSGSDTSSLADQLVGTAMLPLRRYTFRTGNEPLIAHPDPQ
ncbi:MAG: hypothetical protein B7Z37_00445 [Verrucomicrobia bacterium 12-59-8]|nr:MAG: hypothetical protein B7Z37_00445 [Verrucomicrobia bacterium 12-59-8]